MNEIDVASLMDKLTKAVSYKYKGGCAPSIIVSWLPNKTFYVSIVKYNGSHKDKQIMHHATALTLESALQSVTKNFLAAVKEQKNPVDELDEYLHSNKDRRSSVYDDPFG